MRSYPVPLGCGLGVVFGVLVSTMAHGQQIVVSPVAARQIPHAAEPVPGSVHRMVILQGPNRSVHYITSGNLSSSDRLAAYDLERSENGLTYQGDLQSLRQQYVNSERILEPQRLYVQEQLYGTQIRYGSSSMGYYGGGGYGGLGYAGGYSPYYGYGGYGGYGYPRAMVGYLGSSSSSVVRSLQFGMGNEGSFKNAIVQVMARDASVDSTAAARAYDAAMTRAAASPILSRDLALPKSNAPAAPREPSFEKGGKVTIWLGKDKYVGTVREDRPGWVVLQTDKAEVTLRKSEITRSETPAKE